MKHYHAWVPIYGGRGLAMLAAKLGAAGVKRELERGSKRKVRRWWRSQQAAHKALRASGKDGFVRECHLGADCPELAHVVSN